MTMLKVVGLLEIDLQSVSDDAQVLLGALPGNGTFHIARAFSNMQHLREERTELNSLCFGSSNYDRLRPELERVLLTLEKVIHDLKIANDVLRKEAAF
jgi:hypothetical protein